MISRNTIVVMMLALTGVAWAQIGEPVGFPAQGTVTGNNVYIRSKGDPTAYRCGKVGKSTVVVVVAREGDWLQIVPPEGVFSIISKNFVQRTADDWGTVTGTPVHIRAGSSPNVGGTQRHDAIQGYLSEGHEVEIIGEGSDFYKIVPPGGAYVWISANYVRLPGQPAPEERADEPDALVDDRADDDDDSDDDDSPVAPQPLSDAGQQCIAADNMLIAELRKDIADQQLGSALEMYEAIDAPLGSGLQGTLDRRILYVQAAIKRQNDAARVAEMATRTAERRAELARQLAQGGQAEPVGYVAQGVLSVSHLYTDRFLLRDPATNVDVAYVRGVVGMDLSPYVGQMVGVSGRATYDPDTRLNIVAVTKVAVLTAVEPATVPMTPAQPAPAVPVTPAPSEAEAPPPPPPAPPAERVGDGPPAPVAAEPISLQPERAAVEPPPEPEKDLESPAKPDGPGSDEMPDEPVRPPRLIRPHNGDADDPDAMPDRPSRPAKPSVDRPRPPAAEDDEADAPPAQPSAPAEAEDEPEEPKVEMHRPLPPEGLPIEEDQDADGSDIDTSEYE